MVPLFLIPGCKNPSGLNSDKVILNLPSWPPAPLISPQNTIPELSGWKIRIRTKSRTEIFYISKNEKIPPVTIERNSPFSVTAQPVLISPEGEFFTFFMPSGSVYPALAEFSDKGKISLNLSFEDGFTAKVMEQVTESLGEKNINFNWKKFSDIVKTKSQGSYNPWLADFQFIVNKILSQSFTATSLNMKNTSSQSIRSFVPEETDIFSAYIPENTAVIENDCILINCLNENSFLFQNNRLLSIDYRYSKNPSVRILFLPKMVEEKY